MAVAFSHSFKVSGYQKNLDKFKSDLTGNGKYDSPNFRKFKSEIEMVFNDKGICTDFAETELEITSEIIGSCAIYRYGTRRFDFTFIYTILASNYPDLNFDFESINDCDWSSYKASFQKGKLTKHIGLIWKCKDCKDGKAKDVLYEEDYLNKTKRIIHENIFDPEAGHYDDGTHRFVENVKTITQVG